MPTSSPAPKVVPAPIRQVVTGLLLGLTILAHHHNASGQDSAASRLETIFDQQWERAMRESPQWASHLGDLRYNDRWEDLSTAAIEQRHAADIKVLEQLKTIDAAGLSAADRLNLELFRAEYQQAIESHTFQMHLVPLNQRGGIQDANSLADALRFETVKDYEDWLARMHGFPRYMQQTIALMRSGVEQRIVHPRIIMQRVPRQIERQIVETPQDSPFYKPFRSFPDSITAADQERLRMAAATAIEQHIQPSYREFLEFFVNEYLPGCYEHVGCWQHPQGKALYALRTRQFTTTDLTPDQVHEIGLSEVRRIRGEMEKIVREVEFDGTFAEFLDDLRTNPKFYYKDPNELLEAYRAFCRKVDPLLPRLFHRLPRTRYTIEPIPMQIAPDTTTAYYRQPSASGDRPGTYFVNLYRPEVRPTYEIEALSLHESVPGHHLQIALAQELESLPNFRRYGGYTAFIEGWALYSERLGEELGVYSTPYSRFGQLTYEMWRAVRLVVDTGIHHKRWTRQQAIDFFSENTAKTLHDIENEVDRYIAWPGQALAYKIGELKMRELRARAEKELGGRFDLRDFHDVILRNGAIPLDQLEREVDSWLDQSR